MAYSPTDYSILDGVDDYGNPAPTVTDVKLNHGEAGIVDVDTRLTTAEATVAAAVAAITANNAAYRLARERGGSLPQGSASAGRYLLPDAVPVTAGAATAGKSVFQIRSGLWPPPAGLAIKLMLGVSMTTNDVAPGCTFTFQVYPVTATAGATGFNTITIGTAVANLVVVHTTPLANQPNLYLQSADVAIPADGPYTIQVSNSATIAVAGDVTFRANLYWRWA